MAFEFRPIDEESARAVLAWRYAPPYDVYDAASEDPTALVALLDPGNHYLVALSSGELVGFCCFGPDARVAGGDYSAEGLDVGAGFRPDLTGRGSGVAFLGAVVALAVRHAGARPLRATVAAFNARALRACTRVGFREAARFRRPADGAEFVILLRAAGALPKGPELTSESGLLPLSLQPPSATVKEGLLRHDQIADLLETVRGAAGGDRSPRARQQPGVRGLDAGDRN